MTGSLLISFAGVMLLGAMSPGPDFAIVVRRAAVSGRGPGTLTALGVAAGVSVWVVAAATGVAAVVAFSALVYTIVKAIGAAYLLYLGIRALLSARRAAPVDVAAGSPGVSGWAAFRQGLLCNVFNPKAAVFFVALIPQFLPAPATAPDVIGLSVWPWWSPGCGSPWWPTWSAHSDGSSRGRRCGGWWTRSPVPSWWRSASGWPPRPARCSTPALDDHVASVPMPGNHPVPSTGGQGSLLRDHVAGRVHRRRRR